MAGSGKHFDAMDANALHRQDFALRLRSAAAVVTDLAIGPHHAMTRDEIWDWIVRKRCADSAHRRLVANLARDPSIRPDLAARNLLRLAQHSLLKWRDAAQIEPEPPPALELVMDFVGKILRRVNSNHGAP